MTLDPLGLLTPVALYALIAALHVVLPGRWVDGYVRDAEGKPLRYHLNGLQVLATTVALWFTAGWMGWMPWDWLYTVRWEGLISACAMGLIFTAVLVLPAHPTGKGLLADLFLGRLENPQLWGGRVDAKMFLYLVGAVMLELNVLSFVAHHMAVAEGALNPGILLCAAMLTWFVLDYLTFEEVHLYTYDFFAENVGFKLGWGCLTFYPYFYAVGLWATASLPNPGWPTWSLPIVGLVFLSGWSLARGANMQKFFFKTRPGQSFLGIAPEVVSDGERSLLVSGFWGASRHVNYLGEVLMASGIALAVGYPLMPWPWLYPLYYVVLLGTRQRDDDRRCAAKYGPLWQEYTQRVPSRIIPGVY